MLGHYTVQLASCLPLYPGDTLSSRWKAALFTESARAILSLSVELLCPSLHLKRPDNTACNCVREAVFLAVYLGQACIIVTDGGPRRRSCPGCHCGGGSALVADQSKTRGASVWTSEGTAACPPGGSLRSRERGGDSAGCPSDLVWVKAV